MKLPEDAIEEFQALWKDATGDDLEFEIAASQADQLLAVLETVFNTEQ